MIAYDRVEVVYVRVEIWVQSANYRVNASDWGRTRSSRGRVQVLLIEYRSVIHEFTRATRCISDRFQTVWLLEGYTDFCDISKNRDRYRER